jgi:hypothetical protein
MTNTTFIPFEGFYESQFSHAIDMQVESMAEDSDFDEDQVNYIQWHNDIAAKYAAAWITAMSDKVGFTINATFNKMVSPRYYNYETDRIVVDIDNTSITNIFDHIVENFVEEYNAYVKETFTPRSGFIPFYPNDLNVWGDLSDWDSVQVGTMLSFLDETYQLDDYKLDPYEITSSIVY